MEVRVKSVFYDKFDRSRVYNPGNVVDFEEERAKHIVSLSLGELVEDKKEEEKPKTRKKKAE